jgi:membrane associated rhomboid family serine protease
VIFLPLNDTEPNRYSGPPIVTLALITANFLVMVCKPFLWEIFTSDLYTLYGSVPRFLIHEQGGGALASITSTFIHADYVHLAGNMLFLWVFGRRVEDACGPWRYLAFYLLAGLSADLLSTLIRYKEDIPGIGASGAVAGLLGAYLILFPGGRIRTFLLLGVLPAFPRIRAFWFLIYWLVLQIIPAVLVTLSDTSYSVNYWAHLGGFLGGLSIIFFLRSEAFARFLSSAPV